MGFHKFLLTVSLMVSAIISYAQVTTSSMTGTIKDSKGEALIGATVKATHLPSGTVFGTTTQADGRYTLPNMRVGGPYKVEISFVSYGTQSFNDLFLQLGSPLKLDGTLEAGTQTLKEITVSGSRGGIINPNNNGTAVNITRNQIENLPTVNRSVQDFARLSPQAVVSTNGNDGSPNGISFGGQNNRYNQFAVDGAVTNDVFGLAASGTNSGQAGANPISIETIDQIQVIQNPYDIKQSGFTGGGINAITKSGTNTFHGTGWYYFQNEGLVGKSPDTLKSKYGDFSNRIFGANFSGPIIKDKLFFFINAERTKRTNPVDFDPTAGASNIRPDELQTIYDHVLNTYNVDLGGYGAQDKEKESTSLFGRIDWNINSIHRLTFRYNYVDADDINVSRSNSSAYFYNAYYSFPSKTHSSVIELNSAFSNRLSNELRIGYNNVRDRRKYLGDPFPNVVINDAGRTINLGSEFSSSANALDQDIWTVVDNLTFYRGKHTITVGTSNEFYNIKNTFIQAAFGAYVYDSIAGFVNNLKPSRYQINYTTADPTLREGIGFKAAQLSLYVQDEWDVLKNLRLTGGLRVDLPVLPTDPPNNATFEKDPSFTGYSTAQLPKKRLLFAPRVGFNWDVFNNGQTQVRGGAGIFTGRVPFVWISNQYGNTGNVYTNINLSGNAVPASFRFNYDKNDAFYGQYTAEELIGMGANITARPSNINLTSRDFKFPQVFKTNLAVDQQLPWGIVGTLEGNFTKTINNAVWNNLNIVPRGDTTVSFGSGDVKRQAWKRNTGTFGDQVLLLENTSEGYAYNVTAEFTKITSNGLFAKIGYSYGDAFAVNDGTSSTAGSNWRFPPNTNGLNRLDEGPSKFSMGHRILGVVAKTFKYGSQNRKFATTVSLFYNGQSGQPFSWVYFNTVDPTGDDLGTNGNNDLIYIPTSSEVSNMKFDLIQQRVGGAVVYERTEAQQREDLERLMSNDKYLSKHRGQTAEKYAARTPFEHVFDFKLVQVIPIIKQHKLEVTFDILNVGNLLNKDWGRTYFINNNVATPLTFRKWDAATNTPVFQYDRRRVLNGDRDETPYTINNFTSRWRGQIGLRYSF